MSTQNSLHLTVEAAEEILAPFSCTDTLPALSLAERDSLRQALRVFAEASEYQMLGVCAPSAAEGMMALQTYLQGLDHTFNFNVDEIESVEGPVYMKYNTLKGTYYIDAYTGRYQGVLVSCQSSQNGVNGTYGHFPLDLFAAE